MDKFVTLEPVRLYGSSSSSKTGAKPAVLDPRIGRLPQSLHFLILTYTAVPTIPAYARTCRALSVLVRSDDLWKFRWNALALERHKLGGVLDVLEGKSREDKGKQQAKKPPMLKVDDGEDDFGDFASGSGGGLNQLDDEMGEFVGASLSMSVPPTPFGAAAFAARPAPPPQPFPKSLFESIAPLVAPSTPVVDQKTFRTQYVRAHNLLAPCARTLTQPRHLILSALTSLLPASASEPDVASLISPLSPSASIDSTTSTSSTLVLQARLIHALALFLSPTTQPVKNWQALADNLRSAADTFQSALLAAFEDADTRGDEGGMRDAARAGWEVHLATTVTSSAPAQQKRGHGHNRRTSLGAAGMLLGGGTGLSAFGSDGGPGEKFEMSRVWAEKREIFYEGERWRSEDNFTKQNTLAFDAMDSFMSVILKSIREDGARAVRVFPPSAGVLVQFATRIAVEVVSEYIVPLLTRARQLPTPTAAQTYLQAVAASFNEAWKMVPAILEVAQAERYGDPLEGKGSTEDAGVTKDAAEDVVYRMFEPNMDEYLDEEVECVKHALEEICKRWDKKTAAGQTGSQHFIGTHNPALVKRTVLASFTKAILLPVTIVPRAVTAGVGAITTGVGAITTGVGGALRQGVGGGNKQVPDGYSQNFEQGENGILFEMGDDLNDDDEDGEDRMKRASLSSTATANSRPTSTTLSVSDAGGAAAKSLAQFDLLLSLDVAIELIQADRESLKRCETFAGYPGHYGHRVRETIEEIFVLLLQAMADRHLEPGFRTATEQMRSYKPGEHDGEGTSVAPLMQFFELAHLGDMIQSMVQVYFDKELAPHIDKTDFLNAVVREKKRFENTLDEAVAAGLNAGTEVLMNQVEHIIITKTGPRAYYPPEDAAMELGATEGCKEAVKCLDMHCKLLKDSTSKEVLEVFYQEVGFRLIAILQKHIKRQIISLNGGFQVIADLNTYHGFIASLKVSSITSEFAYLKMLGHVYVVEDAKDLAQIVRDVTRYGGAYRPEDIYEFIQRRSDWKKIEKTVDKTMYNLSFKEDCVVA